MLHPAEVDVLRGEQRRGDAQRCGAVVAEIDRRLGEGLAEPVEDDEERDGDHRGADGEEAPVGAIESLVHRLTSS